MPFGWRHKSGLERRKKWKEAMDMKLVLQFTLVSFPVYALTTPLLGKEKKIVTVVLGSLFSKKCTGFSGNLYVL